MISRSLLIAHRTNFESNIATRNSAIEMLAVYKINYTFSITESSFFYNEASEGNTIYFNEAEGLISDTDFYSNNANSITRGILIIGTNLTVTNCIFEEDYSG